MFHLMFHVKHEMKHCEHNCKLYLKYKKVKLYAHNLTF